MKTIEILDGDLSVASGVKNVGVETTVNMGSHRFSTRVSMSPQSARAVARMLYEAANEIDVDGCPVCGLTLKTCERNNRQQSEGE